MGQQLEYHVESVVLGRQLEYLVESVVFGSLARLIRNILQVKAKTKSFTFSLSEFAIDVRQARYVHFRQSHLPSILRNICRVLKVAVRFTGL